MIAAGRLLMGALVVSGMALFASNAYGALMNAGDLAFLAFIGFNEDGSDDFAIVLLADAAASDVVRFNDNEWAGAAFNSIQEDRFSWTVGTTLAAGTVVTFSSLATSPAVSVGSLAGESMGLSADETVYAFLGPDADTPQTFLAAISNSASHYNGPTGTLAGTGLTEGTTAVLLPATGINLADGGQFRDNLRTGQAEFADYLPLIGNTSANWDVDPLDGAQFVPFSTTPFEASNAAIPEPGSLTLMMLVTMIGVARFRRSSVQQSAPRRV
jgi:hypothetical protein